MLWRPLKRGLAETADWRAFVWVFLGVLVGGIVAIYLFILLVDPYDVMPFSLPIDRRIFDTNDRFMHPQIVRSKRFDSLIIGTSTSRLLDPELLDRLFHARFANLAFFNGRAWEERAILDLFLRKVGPPKVLVVGLDWVWCDQEADRHHTPFREFPDWLYDENAWNDYLHLFNSGALKIAGRMVGNQLGLVHELLRYDGYDVFVPPESQYDAVRAHTAIWQGVTPAPGNLLPAPANLPPPLTPAERSRLSFPALSWLDAAIARLPASTLKILAFMPVHVVAQPVPGTRGANIEAECKVRIVAIARRHGARVIDWRIASPLTTNDANYWDSLHYRVPIATRIAEDLSSAALAGRESPDGSYVLLVR